MLSKKEQNNIFPAKTSAASRRAAVALSYNPMSLRATRLQVKWLNERHSRNKTEILAKSSKRNPVGGRKREHKIKGKIKMI